MKCWHTIFICCMPPKRGRAWPVPKYSPAQPGPWAPAALTLPARCSTLTYTDSSLSQTVHSGRIRLSDPDSDSQWIRVPIHMANRTSLGASNASRIHFGFKLIVNPDLDLIIEYALICYTWHGTTALSRFPLHNPSSLVMPVQVTWQRPPTLKC